jgi:NADH-quinone oxidoreductase subunit C
VPANSATFDALKNGCEPLQISEFRGESRVVVSKKKLLDAMRLLKESRRFDLLVDVTCVDYLNYRLSEDKRDAANRFGLVYLLANTETNERLTMRVYLNEPDLSVPSLVPLWAGANWFEREVFDMFGIRFEGHPDLRRILMPEEFAAFPLRKDYPLQGRGERHNFHRITRAEA